MLVINTTPSVFMCLIRFAYFIKYTHLPLSNQGRKMKRFGMSMSLSTHDNPTLQNYCIRCGLMTSLFTLFFEFLLDDTFHLKESANLLSIEDCRKFVYILHSDALGPLLHFHLALG